MTQKRDVERLACFRARVQEPALTALLVIEVVVIFVLIPLTGMSIYALRSIQVPLASLVAVAAVAAIARGRGALVLTFLAAVIGIVVNLLSYAYPSALGASVYPLAILAFLSILTGVVAQVVFGPGRVTGHRVRGAVVLYLHLALIFTFLQGLVLFFAPGAFGEALAATDASVGDKLLYFSFTTLTTVGYGDIVPVHPFARSFANLEAIAGQLYPATLLARVVTLAAAAGRQ
jgi:hypothetical protein